jgi:inosose dehydratase
MTDLTSLRLGTAPDSWGVWFASDPHQVTWDVYLDEIARVGYVYTELGPPGFMPQDARQLADELAARKLTVCGGTVFAGLHKGADALAQAKADFDREAGLLAAVGAQYLVHLPEQYTDQHSGVATQQADIDPDQWQNLVTGTDELARFIFDRHGVRLVFHPHVDTHVDTQDRIERFLADTDPEFVNLCLDTGHIAYCEGDNIEIVQKYPERITYVHLKSVDPAVRARALAENMALSESVKLGVMCEPPYGEPDMPPLLDALGRLDRDIYAVIEQDLYPVEADIPLPIGARTAGYYVGCGLGPVRRWPY